MVRFDHLRSAIPSLLLIVSLVPGAHAWAPVPIPVCVAPMLQQSPTLTQDGVGGAFIAWLDHRGGSPFIYAQHLDRAGWMLWPADGIAVSAAPVQQIAPVVVADGTGGAFVLWVAADGNARARVQHVDAAGAPLWRDEVEVSTVGRDHNDPSACADGADGLLVSWSEDQRSDTALVAIRDIYAQRVDGSGATLWAPEGVAICTAPGGQTGHTIVPDGSGGAIVVWNDGRHAQGSAAFAQRVTAAGAVAWAANGIPLSSGAPYQYYAAACADGAGGAIAAWVGDGGIRVQRIDGSGSLLWGAGGVCAGPGSSGWYSIASDGAQGAYVAFERDEQPARTIRAQRVRDDGALMWSADGKSMVVARGYKSSPRVVRDGGGGAFVTWQDFRGGSDLYGQRVDADGEPLWEIEGARVDVTPGSASSVSMVPDGGRGAILAWYNDGDILAQHIGDQVPATPRPNRKARRLSLDAAQPNPTLEGTTLRFTLPEAATTVLAVHDAQGRRVRGLLNSRLPVGEHTWSWDGLDDSGQRVPSGVYFIRLEAGGERVACRIALLR
jgi:flagellar hook capping protein FlgD